MVLRTKRSLRVSQGIRMAWVLIALGSLHCGPDSNSTPAGPERARLPVSQDDSRARTRVVDKEILEILARRSIVSAGKVDASFSRDGALTSCTIQLRDHALAPGSAEEIGLREEICKAIRSLGRPRPPRDLRFSMSFSLPMTD